MSNCKKRAAVGATMLSSATHCRAALPPTVLAPLAFTNVNVVIAPNAAESQAHTRVQQEHIGILEAKAQVCLLCGCCYSCCRH